MPLDYNTSGGTPLNLLRFCTGMNDEQSRAGAVHVISMTPILEYNVQH